MSRMIAENRRAALGKTLAVSAFVALLTLPGIAEAGKASWLDDIVRQIVRDARAEGRAGGRTVERTTGRLLFREGDESLEALAKRSDDIARLARRGEEPAEALLESRFDRLVRRDSSAARVFRSLAPREKRLAVALGETAQGLARRYPNRAESMIRSLGVEGMTAVRTYGDDVAEVLVKEGPEGIGVLRKTGRPGWKFYTERVLAHKKKLIAAGVLALFLADPDKFVDTAGRATRYATEQFAKAGVSLAAAAGEGASAGFESSIGAFLNSLGLNSAPARKLGVAVALIVAVAALSVLIGLPLRVLFLPLLWPIRFLLRRGKPRIV